MNHKCAQWNDENLTGQPNGSSVRWMLISSPSKALTHHAHAGRRLTDSATQAQSTVRFSYWGNPAKRGCYYKRINQNCRVYDSTFCGSRKSSICFNNCNRCEWKAYFDGLFGILLTTPYWSILTSVWWWTFNDTQRSRFDVVKSMLSYRSIPLWIFSSVASPETDHKLESSVNECTWLTWKW